MLSFNPVNAVASFLNAEASSSTSTGKLPSNWAKFIDRFTPLNATDTTDLAGLVECHKHALANPPPVKKPTAAEKLLRIKNVRFLTTCFNTLARKNERRWYFNCYPRQIRKVLEYTANDPLHPDLNAYHTKKGAGQNASEDAEDAEDAENTEETEEAKEVKAAATKLAKDNAKSAMKTARKALKEANDRRVAPFNPEELEAPTVTDLDTMFSKGNLEKGATLGVLKLDPDPKRVVLGSFNKNGSIMRRPIDYDITGAKIRKADRLDYPQTCRSTIKREDIEYCADWVNVLKDEQGEEELIFKKMSEKGWTSGWGYRDFHHMVYSKQWREQLDESKKRLRHGPEGGAYGPTEIFKRAKISGSDALDYANASYEKIAPIISRFQAAHRYLVEVTDSTEAEQIESANTYMVAMNQLLDHSVVGVGKASEDSASWKVQE